MYPARIFITGDGSFNNFFLFSYYLENFVTDQSTLYTASSSVFNSMADVFATSHNLNHLNCDIKHILEKSNDRERLFRKIAEATDLLLIYGDKSKCGGLIKVFKKLNKEYNFIDILPTDTVIPVQQLKDATISFSDLYGSYLNKIDPEYKCYKFLATLMRDRDLLTLVIQHRNDVYATQDKIEEEIANNLYWIYKNQYATLLDLRKIMLGKSNTGDAHLLTDNYDWKYEGEDTPLYTGTGLLLARRYHGFVKDNNRSLVEIADKDMVKSHVYRALKDMDENEDDDVRLNYHTSDHQSYPLFYQAYHFDGSLIKMGYWYINSRYVKVK